jgi:predicted dehydrogenase
MARRESCIVAGTEGYLNIPKTFRPRNGDSFLYEIQDSKEVQHQFSGCDEYQLMVEHFAECVLEHKPPRYSPVEAAANMRVIESLYRSARHGGAWQPVLPLV